MLSTLRRLLKVGFWRPLSRITRSFHPLPPIGMLLVFLLLIMSGQVGELYLSYLEGAQGYTALPIAFAIVTFALVSATFFISHFWLNPVQHDIVYPNPAELPGIAEYVGLRRYTALALSFLPWVGLAAGFLIARAKISRLNSDIADMAQPFNIMIQKAGPDTGQPIIKPTVDALKTALDNLQYRTLVGVAVALTVGAVVTYLLDRVISRGRQRNVNVLGCCVAGAVGGFIIAAGFPQAFQDPVDTYRGFGSLATLAIGILFFYAIAALLAYLSREARSQSAGFPVLSLALIVTGICIYAGVATADIAMGGCVVAFAACALAVFLRLENPMRWLLFAMGVLAFCIGVRERTLIGREIPVTNGVSAAADPADPSVRNTDLSGKFEDWFKARRDKDKWSAAHKPYPVFIIAVEGGGIYAAAAASTFLARLQDRCAAFAQHVFAISGVSGGSVGATLFQAHINSLEQTDKVGCDTSRFSGGALEKKMAQIILEDHFSPVVGSIVPDLIGQPWDRARGLEESFDRSVSQHDRGAWAVINGNYDKHWSVAGAAPALILNATWAETGIRVAFSPFALSGDSPVYSFFDCKILGGSVRATTTLLAAAVTSARFPGILPPFSVLRRTAVANPAAVRADASDPGCQPPTAAVTEAAGQLKRWNFVDGAYSDSSGAATALDIYQVLETLNVAKSDLDLQLILLTGAPPSTNYDDINGTAFRDLIAPINAILNVRNQLASQSVERAVNYLKSKSGVTTPAENGGEYALPPSVKLIRLRDDIFGLSLGWRISRSTFDLVSSLIGRADICLGKIPSGMLDESKALNDNSCTLQDIEKALMMQ